MEYKNISFENIQEANESIVPILLEHKDKKTGEIKTNKYSEVSQRIKAFRMVYPMGAILTDMISNENGVCVFTATCGYYDDDGKLMVLGTGTAQEKQGSTFINGTSYIENCETSAVGRALGMCGFGIDTSIASAEDVQNAINNQGKEEPKTEPKTEPKATPNQLAVLEKQYTGENLTKLLEANNIEKLEDISLAKASEIITKLKKKAEGKAK